MAARSAARQKRRYDFRGRTVLITGGSRGLGLVLARHFAQAGADLALTARDPDELVRARADLKDYGVDILTFPCDITDQAQVQSLVNTVRQYFGKIDVLVNNAGVIQVGPMETMTLDDYKEEMEVHFWGPLYVTLAVIPEMQQRQSGRIVNISSIGGKISVPHLLPYSASKFALVGLSEGMRGELMKDNVYVTTVCPGLMRTGSHVNAQFKGQNRLEYTLFSLSNAMPFSSIDADAAAAQIVKACRYGDPELVISIPAQIAATFHALFPGVTSDLLGLYNRFLPGPGGIGEERASGQESQTALSPSPLTSLSDQAVIPNNEAG
jgi:short-subunit dehydrogenase